MTVIAWDGRTLVADKRASVAGYAATVTKILRTQGGELIGASGDLDLSRALMAWYCAGADAAAYPDNRSGEYCRAYLMVITREGRVHKYESEPIALPFEDKFAAMGSGRDYALAVMHLGHSARKAVEVACALDTSCGNGIDMLRLK